MYFNNRSLPIFEMGRSLRKSDENALPPVALDKSRRIVLKKSQSASYWEILVNLNPKRFLVNTLYKNTNVIEKIDNYAIPFLSFTASGKGISHVKLFRKYFTVCPMRRFNFLRQGLALLKNKAVTTTPEESCLIEDGT